MRCDKFILHGKLPVAEPNLMRWGAWFETADRSVARTELPNGITISTVFLGIDHGFSGGAPILFETMVFGGQLDQGQWRYSSWEEAEEGHKRAVREACECQ